MTMHGVLDVPEADYHQHPALSASGARKLLPPSCPARFKWERDNPSPPRAVFDFGSAAHALVLGAGADIVVIEHDDWRTKAAKEARDQAHAEGKTPLLTRDYEQVKAMAAALTDHPIVRVLFDPDHGKPEQSLFWTDDTGINLRARLDWLPDTADGRMIVSDYKTCASAAPDQISKALHNYGYAMQAAWYLAGVDALNLADDAAFVFVFQEKDPPYLVTVAEPDRAAIIYGHNKMRRAIDVYRECIETDTWPGYSDDVLLARLPGWVEREVYA
jgi:hypothetical protein